MAWILFLLPISLYFLSGCSPSSDVNLDEFQCSDDPIIENDQDLINPFAFIDLEITLFEENKKYTSSDVIPLYIENTSEHTIWLPMNQNITLWVQIDENDWKKIGNRMDYGGLDDIILEPKDNPDAKNLIFIHPVVTVEDTSREIFVTLWGYRFESGQYCEDRHGGRITIEIFPDN
jgi:hypothetical protein